MTNRFKLRWLLVTTIWEVKVHYLAGWGTKFVMLKCRTTDIP